MRLIDTALEIRDALLAGETDWTKYGRIKTDHNGSLVLFSYTHEAQWANEWNAYERVCRGLIIDKTTGEIVAQPFPKFFNYGQQYGASGESVALPRNGTHLVNVFEKVDGSLGILYRQDGEHKIATRGSFFSNQAAWATNYLNIYFYVDEIPYTWTLLFEIIYPENKELSPIVVNYGDRTDLVLLAIFDRYTGDELPFSTVKEFATYMGFSTPVVYELNSYEEVICAANELVGTEQEGYVLLYSNGQRFKVKGDDYVWLHKIINNISKKNAYEMWKNGKDMPDIPDEFIQQIEEWYDEFNTVSNDITQEIVRAYDAAPKTSRKEFAVAVKEHRYSGALFAMVDGKNASSMVMKYVGQECL
jgi:RNA ligase